MEESHEVQPKLITQVAKTQVTQSVQTMCNGTGKHIYNQRTDTTDVQHDKLETSQEDSRTHKHSKLLSLNQEKGSSQQNLPCSQPQGTAYVQDQSPSLVPSRHDTSTNRPEDILMVKAVSLNGILFSMCPLCHVLCAPNEGIMKHLQTHNDSTPLSGNQVCQDPGNILTNKKPVRTWRNMPQPV